MSFEYTLTREKKNNNINEVITLKEKEHRTAQTHTYIHVEKERKGECRKTAKNKQEKRMKKQKNLIILYT